MKRVFLFSFLVLTTVLAQGQNSYIVKTNNVKETLEDFQDQDSVKEEKEEDDKENFVNKNFKYASMCDWQEGMKFMVVPTKYDLIVSQFFDAATKKEASLGPLRYKTMIYKGHEIAPDGKDHVNFYCPDNNGNYYYEIPNGVFEDYCYGKLGVPSLAYLGDVDLARELLTGKTLYTVGTKYFIDLPGGNVEEVKIEKNIPVEVVAVGVGERAYPVKIIVKDADGKEFFQNVAMSLTNCGFRVDEMPQLDIKFHLFDNSFRLSDTNIKKSMSYSNYIGRTVYLRYATTMYASNGEKVNMARNSKFLITKIEAQTNSDRVMMTLKGSTSGQEYRKSVTFVNKVVTGDIDGYQEDYYNYLFSDIKLTGKAGKSITVRTRRNR